MTHHFDLLAHLQTEIQAISQFYDTLQAEEKALTSGDVDALTALAQAKQQQAETINNLDAVRKRHMAAIGLNANANGMQQWLDMSGEAVQQAWKQLLEIARNAQQTNQSNGILIQQSLKHNQQALTILMSAVNPLNLYGSNGHSQGAYPGSGGSRGIIDKA